jgi:hypothetical protein
MANASAAATRWNCPNYVGELYMIGANQTPFLNMIGGLQGGMTKLVGSFDFSLAQPWNLESAAQPAITETASLTAPTPVTYVRGQDVNTVQIFQRQVSVSYAKQSSRGAVTADSTTALPKWAISPCRTKRTSRSRPICDRSPWMWNIRF